MSEQPTSEMKDFFTGLSDVLSDAARSAGLTDAFSGYLRYPERVVSANLVLQKDDGQLQHLKAWRSLHSTMLGPGKGGIRFHPSVGMREVMALSSLMSIKCALLDLPLGGAKGGVQVDASSLSLTEHERLARTYMRAFFPVLGPDTDIAAPDMYTTAQTMAWMSDEYAKLAGQHEPACITGKPAASGGIEARDGATGNGAFEAFSALAPWLNSSIDGSSVIVIGLGSAGATLASRLDQAGAKIVGVADSSAALFDENGLPVAELIELKRSGSRLSSRRASGSTEKLALDDLLSRQCDVLVPAATGQMIHQQNVAAIKASTILELANMPITHEADSYLTDQGVTVIPDVLANAGGVTVSYFEWVQNRMRYAWTGGRVEDEMKDRMSRAATAVAERAQQLDCSLRQASYQIALKRMAQANTHPNSLLIERNEDG